MRGVVASPKYNFGSHGITVEDGIDPIELRNYLLYWDKIDIPNNNSIYLGSSEEMDFLEEEKILKRSFIKMDNSDLIFTPEKVKSVYSKMQLSAFKNNEELESGSWVLAQPNVDLFMNKEDSEMTRVLEIELDKCLPSITGNVPLENILRFKSKRADELLALQITLKEFYQNIINSVDSNHEMIKTKNTIELQLKNLDRVMQESSLDRFYQSIKVKYDLTAIGAPIGMGLFGGLGGFFPLFEGLATGILAGLAAGVRVTSETSFKPKNIPSELEDYAYLFYAKKEI